MSSRSCRVIASFGRALPALDVGRTIELEPAFATRTRPRRGVMLLAMLHEISVVSAVTGPPGRRRSRAEFRTVRTRPHRDAHHHRQAETVRGIDGEQLVGDCDERFAHGDTVAILGQMAYFDPASSAVTTVVWDGVPPNNRRVSV